MTASLERAAITPLFEEKNPPFSAADEKANHYDGGQYDFHKLPVII
jgi:hypothetical protein